MVSGGVRYGTVLFPKKYANKLREDTRICVCAYELQMQMKMLENYISFSRNSHRGGRGQGGREECWKILVNMRAFANHVVIFTNGFL